MVQPTDALASEHQPTDGQEDQSSASASPKAAAPKAAPKPVSKGYAHLFKYVAVGDSGEGKTALIKRYVTGDFIDTHIPTIGVDFDIKTVELSNGDQVKLQLWDTAGEERFRTITSSYYRGSNAILIVYDVNDSDSFDIITRWLMEAARYCKEDAVLAVVGNKTDLIKPESTKPLEADKIQEMLQKELGSDILKLVLGVYECSAKTGEGVDQVFQAITDELVSRRLDARNPLRKGKNALKGDKPIKLKNDDSQGKKKGCC